MKLSVPLVRQHPESDDCLRCCGLMVLRYFGVKISQQQLWKKLYVYKKGSGLLGGYMQDLGRIVQETGLKATIYHYDWSWWNKEMVKAVDKDSKALILALEKLKKTKTKPSDQKIIQKEIEFVKAGGRFRFEIPELNRIDKFLTRKVPVIITVRAEVLYHDPKENYNHAIVVVGKEKDNYLINDPYLPVKKVAAKELYVAWVRIGGWMLVIEDNIR